MTSVKHLASAQRAVKDTSDRCGGEPGLSSGLSPRDVSAAWDGIALGEPVATSQGLLAATAELARLIHDLGHGAEFAGKLGPAIEAVGAVDEDLSFRAGDDDAGRALLGRMLAIPSDRAPEWTSTGMRLAARRGERSRLFLSELRSNGGISAHFLLTVHHPRSGEALLTLRLVRGNDAEENVVAFRRDTILLSGQVERRFRADAVTRLVSVFFCDGIVEVYLNGVLVWRRYSTRAGVPDGLNLDLIGVAEDEATCVVHWLSIGQPSQRPAAFDNTVVPLAVIRTAVLDSDYERLGRLVHAYADQPLPFEEGEVSCMLNALARIDNAYPAHIADAFRDRLETKERLRAQDVSAGPNPVITFEDVAVELPANPAGDSTLFKLLRRRDRQLLNILSAVRFSVYPGDIVGVIGKNGAGKSTLLRTIVGAVPIATGRIGIRGEAILLRPGAGMQGELTGRQNILKAGLYMGLSPAEVRAVMTDVIDFSELRDHIDRPFRYYSDGMRSRLIFALATCVSREILMLDELLSAGDAGFQKKAMKRLDGFLGSAKVVLVVQHTFDFVLTRCTKCLYLKGGRQVYFGHPKIAIEMYKEDLG